MGGTTVRGVNQELTTPTDDAPVSKSEKWLVLRGVLPDESCVLPLKNARRFCFGRHIENDYVLPHSSVSAFHFEVTRQGPILALRDCGSTNGTFLDGSRVEHCVLAEGNVVRAGHWLGVVEEVNDDDTMPKFDEVAPRTFGGLAIARLARVGKQIAATKLPVVLVGETGSGKEVIARALHLWSQRKGAFHAVNCGAIPDTLAEAELFGYRRGAFTGASQDHPGQLQAAHGGTLLLDEIAELPLLLQAKLLRALETGEVTPLGDVRSQCFDARIIAATPVPLQTLVAQGRFREDLAARLNGIALTIPPLRTRRADIPSLFRHFAVACGAHKLQVSTKFLERLCIYHWPGNVRELALFAQRTIALYGTAALLEPRHFSDTLDGPPNPTETPSPIIGSRSRNEYDLVRLRKALIESGGNVKSAAEKLGFSRQRAYRLLGSVGKRGPQNGEVV